MGNETETAPLPKEGDAGVKTAGASPLGSGIKQDAVKPAAFLDLEQKAANPPSASGNMNLLLDVPLKVAVHLGSTKMLIKDLLRLGQGSVVELNKIAGDPMDIFIGEKLIARGEIVVVNEMFGVRITDIISPVERIETLK